MATCLSALAGYVDALGFLELGGYFVSFMTGNSTRLGVGMAERLSSALLPLMLVVLFVAGVVLGSLIGQAAGPRRPSWVLVFVATTLAVAAVLALVGMPFFAAAAMALAMGSENTVFERDGEVSIGLTYMTGTLVKLGQRITLALKGGDRRAWVWYFMLWLGLVAGVVCGALSYAYVGLGALWFAALLAAGFAAAARFFVETRAYP